MSCSCKVLVEMKHCHCLPEEVLPTKRLRKIAISTTLEGNRQMLIHLQTLSKTQFFVEVQKQSPNRTQTLTSILSVTFTGQMKLVLGQSLYEIQRF